jgi:hypothetical protein
VLLSPYDVRQGNFVGMLVNAVTKTGTNEFKGSAYLYARDQAITRKQDYLSDFEQQQFGFSVGGPIVKNRAFFYLNPEWQRQIQPTPGPFVGSTDLPAPVDQATIDRVNQALAQYGITGGSGAYISNQNPLTNLFARVDVSLPYSSRLVLRHNHSSGTRTSFSRPENGSEFRLTDNAFEFSNKTNSSVAQLFTNWANGSANELMLGYKVIDDSRITDQEIAQISVRVPRTVGTGSTNLVAGTERSSQGNELYQTSFELTDNFTLPLGAHTLTIGTKNIFYYSDNLFAQDRFGTWQFNSLDSLRGTCATCAGQPRAQSYSVRVPVGEQARAKFHSATYGFYIQDQWKLRPNMNLMLGLRADLPTFKESPPNNAAFEADQAYRRVLGPIVTDQFGRETYSVTTDANFVRRTSDMPSPKVEWSPRIGFNWDITGDERNQFRAGAGLFSGPPAYVWLSNAYGNTGVSGFPALNCNNASATSPFRPPPFSADAVKNPPQACGGGATPAVAGTLTILHPDFHFPQTYKTTAGFDHRFSGSLLGGLLRDVVGTAEVMYSKARYQPFYVNIALAEPDVTNPASYNRQGRLMYGTISGTSSSPRLVGTRNEVYDVINSDKDWSYNITAGLTKRYSDRWEGSLFYTYQQARDLQSTSNSTAGSNFGQARLNAGSQYSQELARSRWETPHRIISTGTYTFPTKTSVTLIYTGNAGPAYGYYYFTDENADGQASNDPVYVPSDVRDVNQIRLRQIAASGSTPAVTIEQQQEALDTFINNVDCLNGHRGRILTRNSCRGPWVNLIDFSVRQNISTVRGQSVTLVWDVFNFGNLLNKNWGLIREAGDPGFPGVRLLRRVATTTVNGVVEPLYEFNKDMEYSNHQFAASNYRMQLSLRYSF